METILPNVVLLGVLTLAGGFALVAHEVVKRLFDERQLKLQITLHQVKTRTDLENRMETLEVETKKVTTGLIEDVLKLRNTLHLIRR